MTFLHLLKHKFNEFDISEYIDYISTYIIAEIPVGIMHKHHIIPRYMQDLFDVNLNSVDNIITLDIESHCVAHIKLAECFPENTIHWISNIHAAHRIYTTLEISNSVDQAEIQKKKSAAQINMWKDPIFQQKMKAIRESESFQLNYKQGIKNRSNNQIWLRNLKLASDKKWLDPVFVKKQYDLTQNTDRNNKIGKASSERWNDESYRNNQITKIKSRWQDTEFKLKRAQSLKLAMDNPEYKKKKSIESKSRWQDPEFRKKMQIIKEAQNSGNRVLILQVSSGTIYKSIKETMKTLNLKRRQINEYIDSGILMKIKK